MAKSHFTAEGEVTFKSILFVPKSAPLDMFQNYGKRVDHIKMYVRRVFITDNFEDMMPKYLSFVRGVVSSSSQLNLTCLRFIFSARQHAERTIYYRKSVCPSHGWISRKRLTMQFSPHSSPTSPVCGISFILKLLRDPPSGGIK